MTSDHQLAIQTREWTLPDRTETQHQLEAIRAFQMACRQHLTREVDYGTIPGTQRPTLLKPGAEKIARLLGLADEYDILEDEKDWGKGFFHFQVKCRLVYLATGTVVTTGLGECNSMEARYRYRWLWERELPEGFQKQGIVFRTTKNGGKQYRVENEDIYSQVNTILKMAKKRALVDAALSAGRLSEIFTQDMEDLADLPPTDHEEVPERPAQRTRATQASRPQPRPAAERPAPPQGQPGPSREKLDQLNKARYGDPDENGEKPEVVTLDALQEYIAGNYAERTIRQLTDAELDEVIEAVLQGRVR